MRLWQICLISAAAVFIPPPQSYAASDGFLKPGSYDKDVVIPNPEDSPLAEALLQLGVAVRKHRYPGSFYFKVRQEPDFVVFIYYPDENTYVGRFTFTKDADNAAPVEAQFISEFVPWLQRNAWPKLKPPGPAQKPSTAR